MISVCIATFNGERFIKKQLDSILSQIGDEDEIIISDDGSTDKTLEIIEEYGDKRIKIYSHQKKQDLQKIKKLRNFYLATSNFENALVRVQGDYIFLADQDDIWKNDKVIKTIKCLEKNDICMSNFSIIDDTDRIINDRFYQSTPISKSLLVNIMKSRFLGCCMAFRKSVLNYVLPFPNKLIGHDYWIGCLGVHKFKFSFIEDSLHLYRRTNNNVSSSTGKSQNSIIQRINYRICFLMQIIFRIIKKQ